jgi:Spy/CpxP family protein refolding chaperone
MKTNLKSIRHTLAGMVLTGGALLAVATGFSPASAAGDATAAAPGAPDHRPHGFGPEHMFSKLGLTAEQQASIKSIVTAARPQMQTLHGQMQANHLKLMQTKPDDPNYGNVVAEVAQSNATLASQRTTQAAELRSQMYAVLTPAQKTQLATLEAQEAAHPHHGHGGPHGPGAD